MGILDRIERTLDRGVTSVFSQGRGQLKPLDLAQGLKRECDDQIPVLDRNLPLAPNVYTVYLHSEDFDRFASWNSRLCRGRSASARPGQRFPPTRGRKMLLRRFITC
ncbi:DUF3662 domain-containing protein [Herbaspirillum sp. VT-16-41]|uniref:DUF3662 domain-containing protein n=1 Tax=Herbaspirillum sp. VT-16-41 TaxID=1953765 RepID=UPI0026CCB006